LEVRERWGGWGFIGFFIEMGWWGTMGKDFN
jgi:hypothetical protein